MNEAMMKLSGKGGWLVGLGILIVAMLCMTLPGCSRGEVELKNTVTAYNKMLSEALAKPDANLMEYFASLAERQRIDAYITFLLKDRKVAICTLKKLDFNRIYRDRDKKQATVATTEEWTYHYVDERSRQPISEEESLHYNNVYHLVEQEGHWLVEKLDMNETQKPKR